MGNGGLLRILVLPVPCPQVALRIRPLNSTELEEGATVIAHKVGDQVRLEVFAQVAWLCSGAELS